MRKNRSIVLETKKEEKRKDGKWECHLVSTSGIREALREGVRGQKVSTGKRLTPQTEIKYI